MPWMETNSTDWPARSTVNAILDCYGKLHKQRRRRRWDHPGAAPLVTERANQVWLVDFKGQFKPLDGVYCYPLTVSDPFSRSVLLCKALESVKTRGAKPAFRRLFREVGLPEAIRSDNGAPFASTGIHGLCELNVWWMQLGIVHQRITPASPQEPAGPAGEVRSLPPAIQRGAPPRRPRRREASGSLAALNAAVSGAHPATRVPGSPGSATGQHGRLLSPAPQAAVPHARPR
jgi:hypothetical protein